MPFLPDPVVHAALDALLKDGATRWLLLSETEPILGATKYSGITEAAMARVEVAPADWPAASGRAAEVTVILPDPVVDLGTFPFWGLADSGTSGADDVTLAGRFAEPIDLPAGATNCEATPRVEAPASFTVLP